MICSIRFFLSFILFLAASCLVAAPPVPFSGKLAVDGKNFHGNALFAFSLVDGEGAVHWKHANEPDARIENFVMNGRYLVLLGGQGMQTLPADLFLKHDSLFLRVSVDLKDGKGLRLLEPDQRITSSPYALSAEIARLAEKASVADGVTPGAITAGMIDTGLLADLNRTAGITEITREMLPQDVRDDLNRTITKSMLSQEVLNELNSSSGGGGVVPGSLLAVPANQSAPSGYSLFQAEASGERKDLVWEEKAPVSVARYAYDGVEVLGGKIYFVGGYDGSAKKIAKRYDATTASWEALPDMTVAREGLASAVLDGRLYAIGGVGLSSVEVFDPTDNSWHTGTALPSVLRLGTALTVNGKIYLFGGQASNQNSNQVLCFDPSTSQWTGKANMPTARHGMKLVWFENRIWAIGGGNGSSINIVESYDPSTDTWQTEVSLTSSRNWPVAWVANGRIYVGGGNDGPSFLNDIEVYDPTTEQWASAGNFPENKHGADAVVLNDKAYVVAGYNGSGYSSKVFAADLNASVSGVFDLYRKDGNASSGVPTVQAEVADGSIGPSQLSSEVSNALKPVVVGQPSSVVGVDEQSVVLDVDVDGVNLSYQWKKDGVDIAGATSRNLSITELNATQHEGNYTVVVSNAFGSVTSSVAQIDVNGSLTEGLVGWWKFDETEGTVASDSSGNGNGGTLINGPTWTEGKIGGALSFDGVDDYVNLGNVLPSSYSKVAWVKKTDTYNGNILSFDDSHALWIRADNYLAATHFNPNSVELRDNALFPNNKWMHVCSTYEANTQVMSLLKNGSVINSSSNVQGLGTNVQVFAGKFKIFNYLNGLIDDVRIYNRALSAFEVKALYELGEQPVQESGSGSATVVNGTVADGSITASKIADQTITTNQLSEQILKYLKPEITQQPTAGTIFADTNHTISVSAEGKYLTYQWKENGVNLAGETNATLTITDANATQHDGNYTVVVSNDFGSVESGECNFQFSDPLNGLVAWWKFDETEGTIAYDSSGNGNDGNLTNGPTWTVGKIDGALSFDGSDDFVNFPVSSYPVGEYANVSFWAFGGNNLPKDNHIFKAGNSSSSNLFNVHMTWATSLKLFFDFGNSSGVDRISKFGVSTDFKGSWQFWNLSKNTPNGTMSVHKNGQVWHTESEINNELATIDELEFFKMGDGYHGLIDDVRIYNRALSTSEILSLYQLGQ